MRRPAPKSRSNRVQSLRLDQRLEARDHRRYRQRLALAGAPVLDLGLARGEPARPQDDLVGNADQVGSGELGAGGLLAVIVQHVDARGLELPVEALGGGIARRVARLEVDEYR